MTKSLSNSSPLIFFSGHVDMTPSHDSCRVVVCTSMTQRCSVRLTSSDGGAQLIFISSKPAEDDVSFVVGVPSGDGYADVQLVVRSPNCAFV